MYDFGNSFHVNLDNLKAQTEAVILGKKYRITVLTERLVRLEYSPSFIFNDLQTELVQFRNFPIASYTKKEDENYLEIETSYFKLTYTKEEPFKGSLFNPSKNFRVEVKDSNVIWYFGHAEARNYYGNNISTEVKETEKDYNKGLFSLDGVVSLDDSKNYRINSLGSFEEPIKGNIDTYLFVYNKDFGLCIQDYFKLTGMPSLIPRYALGNWWSRNLAYTSEDILKLVNKFESEEIPLSVFIFDEKWKNTGENKAYYSFNPRLITNPKEITDYLHSKGIRVGAHIDHSDAITKNERGYEDIKKFLNIENEEDIFIKVNDPQKLDVLLKYVLVNLENDGIDFFWNANKEDKNLSELWLIVNYVYNNLARNPAKRGMILSRNSTKAAHRYPVLYAGSSEVNWSNFTSMPFFTLSASNIGVCWWSHDIGGYNKGIEDPDLYLRSVQLGTFSPILRFRSASGKYYKREPWRWDFNVFGIASKYLRLRHKLMSYLYTEAYKYHKTGSMIFQPLYYYLPKVYDDNVYRNEYFFGSELLVAPIVNKKDPVMNRTIHRFYLPEGVWYEFTSGKRYNGGKKYISFYKQEDYPVFAKKGSIIPLSLKSNINNTSNPTDLEIQVFPGKNNTYRLYEDDGISSLYKEGFYLITEIDYNYLPNNYTLIIRSVEGKSGIVPDKRNYKIKFRNTKYTDDVDVYFNADKIDIKNKYVKKNDFILEIDNISTVGQLTINCKGQDIEIDAVGVLTDDIDNILLDLQIPTELKEEVADIMFGNEEYKKKRLQIRKLKKKLDKSFIKLFLKLLDYIENTN